MIIEDTNLFLKYAVPCGSVLVKRGTLKRARLDYLEMCAAKGIEPDGDLENDFKIGVRMLTLTAERMGKGSIDNEVIRKYFWKDHKKCVEWRAKMLSDVEPDQCMVSSGKIIAVNGDDALIETSAGRKTVKRMFEPGVKEDDWVVTHYDHIVEKVTPEQAGKVDE